MCGLAFLFDATGTLGTAAAARMRAATAHRGPDGSGSAQFGSGGPGTCYLEHNRLKVVDLSEAAHQPMLSADGRYALAYNGEIYNHHALRAELVGQGSYFSSHSDTEVLLQLLIRDGAAALPKLRGMFAFVFYDTVQHRLLAARDGFGLKPLYWAQSVRGVAISSEMGGITASGLVAEAGAAFDAGCLPAYLAARYITAPATCRPGVWELPLGHLLENEGPQWVVKPWRTGQETANAPSVEKLLTQSLNRHIAADVPVGLWLSGGVDSTLLLALACAQGRQLPCFSAALRPEEGSFGSGDGQYARRAAKLYNSDYHEFEVDHTLLLHTDDALSALGQPIADTSVLLTWWLARQTSQTVKVVLSGAGADELFGGYNRHRAFAWYLRNKRWLGPAAAAFRAGAAWLPTAQEGRFRKKLRLARHLARRLAATPAETWRQFVSLDPHLLTLLQRPPPATAVNSASCRSLPEHAWQDDLRMALAHDQHHYLAGDILALTDQAAMRHGLEVRTPYLDQDLAAYTSALPAGELLRHGTKWMLRALLDQHGGQAFTRRAKEGFGLPITRWLRLPAYEWLFAPLRRRDHPLFAHFHYVRTQQFLTLFHTGRHDLGPEAWALITLFRWHDLQPYSLPGS